MSSTNYDQLIDCYGRTNFIFVDLNGYVPVPYMRKPNTIYEITKEICVDPNEVIWDTLILVDSVESAIKDPWDWYQLFDFDLETGEIFEIVDGLHKLVLSDAIIDPNIQIPEGHSYVHFLYSPDKLIEVLVDGGEFDSQWPFDKLYDYTSSGDLVTIVSNIGYKFIESKSELGSLNDRIGKDGIDDVFYMSTEDVANSTE